MKKNTQKTNIAQSQICDIPISTEATKEELDDAWIDEYRVKYSKDRKRLLRGNDDLLSYNILPGTEVICDGAFPLCSSLREITIPSSVTHIGDSAFSWCKSLGEITILSSVTHIGSNPFVYCGALFNINCQSKHFVFRDDALYTSDMTKIIAYIGKANTFTIPSSVTHIGDSAFSSCESLGKITIPNSVTQIGAFAFSWCESLREITIPSSVTHIGNFAFSGCSSLREITIPSSVTHIGYHAFSGCYSLKSIKIPKGTRDKFEKMVEKDYWRKLVEI
ncbi:MAG: leucine-rich repeat domain-containing protein [Bacteroidaceae bacterium]|nr:leucine-rich repeat domain-containing protein [Bacteroidaceae bacterium]